MAKKKIHLPLSLEDLREKTCAECTKWKNRGRVIDERIRILNARIIRLTAQIRKQPNEARQRVIELEDGTTRAYWKDASIECLCADKVIPKTKMKELSEEFPDMGSLERYRVTRGFRHLDYLPLSCQKALDAKCIKWVKKYATDYVVPESADAHFGKVAQLANGTICLPEQ